jgi:uncharacterized membrane protein
MASIFATWTIMKTLVYVRVAGKTEKLVTLSTYGRRLLIVRCVLSRLEFSSASKTLELL